MRIGPAARIASHDGLGGDELRVDKTWFPRGSGEQSPHKYPDEAPRLDRIGFVPSSVESFSVQ